MYRKITQEVKILVTDRARHFTCVIYFAFQFSAFVIIDFTQNSDFYEAKSLNRAVYVTLASWFSDVLYTPTDPKYRSSRCAISRLTDSPHLFYPTPRSSLYPEGSRGNLTCTEPRSFLRGNSLFQPSINALALSVALKAVLTHAGRMYY